MNKQRKIEEIIQNLDRIISDIEEDSCARGIFSYLRNELEVFHQIFGERKLTAEESLRFKALCSDISGFLYSWLSRDNMPTS